MASSPDHQVTRLALDQLTELNAYCGEMDLFTQFVGVVKRDGLTFESPLEVVFAHWFYGHQRVMKIAEPLTLRSQQTVTAKDGKVYRLDFQVVAHIGYEATPLKLAVELDGHGFHERTREQVATRDARDRALQDAGYRVFHFSFGEMTQNQSKCVMEVIDAAVAMRKALLAVA